MVGALSLATDLGTGQPLEHALRTAALAVQSGRARWSIRRGARRQLLRRPPPCVRMHVERTRSGAGVRRRHRAQSRVLPYRHRPTPTEVLAFYRAYVGAGRSPEVRDTMPRGGHRQHLREVFVTRSRRCARWRGAVRRWVGLASSVPDSARVRLRPLGRTRIPGRGRRRDSAAGTSPARGQGHLPLPDSRRRRRGTKRRRASVGWPRTSPGSPSSP